MTLDQYLRSKGAPSTADFAAIVGISEASLSRIRNGSQNVSRNVMRTIIEKSGGIVTADSLVLAARRPTPEAERAVA